MAEFTQKTKKKEFKQADLSLYGKVPPQAIDIEEAVLGSMMLNQNALNIIIDQLTPAMFYKETNSKIFTAIQHLFQSSSPIDILTVTNELKTMGDLDIVGGPYYIASLTNRVSSAANIEFHVRILAEKFIQRELIRVSNDVLVDAYKDTTDAIELLDKAAQDMFEIAESNFKKKVQDMPNIVREAIKNIEKAKDHEDQLSGIPTGFVELDRITSGWQRSDLIILAARPGMGKTAFVLSMARNMAVMYNKPIAVFSLEMSAIQLVTRLIASESRIPNDKLKSGKLDSHEWQQLLDKITPLTEAKMMIDDTPGLSIFELRAKARRFKQQHDIQCIVIDYLQLMTAGGDAKGNREQEISTISRSLKNLAKELDIPIIALSQLNRGVETRTGSKKPVLADLRESGAIEQDADMVLFIYRPEYYKLEEFEDHTPTQGMAEIIIAKHRNGALADVRLRFIAQFAQFDNVESENDGAPFMLPNDSFDSSTPFTTKTVQSKMNDDYDDEQPF
jgi:replicative DNA helicase